MSNFLIGLTAGTMTDVAALTADSEAPFGQFKSWYKVIDLGSGLARGVGRPWAVWTWTIIPPLQKTAIRAAYCPSPNKSARVFIQTINNLTTGSIATYEAALIWPDHENLFTTGGFSLAYSNQDQASFHLLFRDLIQQ